MEPVKRRDVIKLAAAGVLAANVHDATAAAGSPTPPGANAPTARPAKNGGVPTRVLGRTGVDVSILGLGGYLKSARLQADDAG